MYTSVLHTFSYAVIVASVSISINRKNEVMDANSKTQIHLKPLIITCALTDIIIISAPIVAGRKARHYLTSPHGDVRKLNISLPRYKASQNPKDIDTIKVKFINKTKIIIPENNYNVFNVNFGQSDSWTNTEDTFGDKEKAMEANDFMIGPVGEEDNGNWEVSALYEDEAGELTDVSQVITLDIIEIVPAEPRFQTLRPGETFKLAFAYSISNLDNCQLTVPKSTFDRFYDRDLADPATCGYVVQNVTAADSGLWSIIGVGRIAYYATTQLTVK